MDFKDLQHALSRIENRRIGKTRSAVSLAQSIEGVLVTFSEESAKKLQKEHGCEVRSVRNLKWAYGFKKPIVFDQDAFLAVASEGVKQQENIERLERKIEDLKILLREFESCRNGFSFCQRKKGIEE